MIDSEEGKTNEQKVYSGVAEWAISKSPCSPHTTSIILFVVIILSFALSAFVVGELERFIQDISAFTVVFAFAIVCYFVNYRCNSCGGGASLLSLTLIKKHGLPAS